MTRLRPAPSWLTALPIAHRGYHDLAKGRAENSLGAFMAAVAEGFAIECDVQVSGTGEPVVFHDPALKRMTGIDGNVRDHSPDELQKFRLLDTADGIYSLSQHLEAVNGKVPLVVEVKGVEGFDAGLVEGVAKALEDYPGPVCVMSFDHWICAQFATLMPDIPRGLTAEGGAETADLHRQAMQDFDLNFISYAVYDLPNSFIEDARKEGLPVISWTIRNPESRAVADLYSDQITFEGFDPRVAVDG